ncbi:unnamed protein product, partial [Vitis vinifera]|uniref:Uncharacterized protein n=1 Tax=Vitis vinifera TaxID=29760 RepID=D7SZB5_VITVI
MNKEHPPEPLDFFIWTVEEKTCAYKEKPSGIRATNVNSIFEFHVKTLTLHGFGITSKSSHLFQ